MGSGLDLQLKSINLLFRFSLRAISFFVFATLEPLMNESIQVMSQSVKWYIFLFTKANKAEYHALLIGFAYPENALH